MTTLAIHGGPKVRSKPFPAYRTVGQEEKDALCEVIDSGILSGFLGAWHEKFHGGVQVRELERAWQEYFQVKHAITVNSNSSGLIAAMGAAGIGPGDEVIVAPNSMSISAIAPLFYGGIPVFADVDEDFFCIAPQAVESRITPRTRAILAVDILGHPYDSEAINAIAKKHGLLVIEDAAQAIGGTFKDRFSGNLGDLGVFSLNYHKHIHSGEGGVVVTEDDELADRIRLIRNHAESVVGEMGYRNLTNMLGYNFRMTELEAAVARCQLEKLPWLVERRIRNCHYLARKLEEIPAIRAPKSRPGVRHVYYVQGFKFDQDNAGVSRDTFIEAVRAELPPMELREEEGVLIRAGYVKPLYLLPVFQQRTAIGSNGFPFHLAEGGVDYRPGLCPVWEDLEANELFILLDLAHPFLEESDMDAVAEAFYKVWDHKSRLAGA